MAHIDEPLARHADAAETWRFISDNVLRAGIVDQSVKELCFRYLSDPDAIDVDNFRGRERAA